MGSLNLVTVISRYLWIPITLNYRKQRQAQSAFSSPREELSLTHKKKVGWVGGRVCRAGMGWGVGRAVDGSGLGGGRLGIVSCG